MTRNVREKLLEDAEHGGGARLVDDELLIRQADFGRDVGPSLKLARLPFERGHQAEVVEYCGPEVGGYLADRADRRIDLLHMDSRRSEAAAKAASSGWLSRRRTQAPSIFNPVSSCPRPSWISRASAERSSS